MKFVRKWSHWWRTSETVLARWLRAAHSALLGEMPKTGGTAMVRGATCFVAQQAWLASATVEANIVFGRPTDAARYRRVVAACALRPDLAALPNGDQTPVGEKGVMLSGGQKQVRSSLRLLTGPPLAPL